MPVDITPMKISVLLWSWKQEQNKREKLLSFLKRSCCLKCFFFFAHPKMKTLNEKNICLISFQTNNFLTFMGHKSYAKCSFPYNESTFSAQSLLKLYNSRVWGTDMKWAFLFEWLSLYVTKSLVCTYIMKQLWHTYPCIVQFHSIEFQRSCRVQIIEFRLCWVKSTLSRPK